MADFCTAAYIYCENLHPLDQFRAFKTLRDQGIDITEIAAHFFVTPLYVKQRLKLAIVSPKLLEIYELGAYQSDRHLHLG